MNALSDLTSSMKHQKWALSKHSFLINRFINECDVFEDRHPETAARKVAIENAVVSNKIGVLQTSLKSHGDDVAKVSKAVAALASQLNQLKINSKMERLNADVKALGRLKEKITLLFYNANR